MNLPPNILNAVQVWDSWAESRKRNADDPVIPLCKDLQTMTPQQFSIVVSMFVMEVKGKKRPGSRNYITRILSNIQQYLDKERIRNASFGKHNHVLLTSKLRQTIRKRFRFKQNYLSTGIERQLWQDAILDCKSSVGLSYAIYFYNVKIFGITSARDHQCLKPHFFTFSENANGQYVSLDCTMLSSYDMHKTRCICKKRKAMTKEVETPIKIIHYEDPENLRSYYKLLKIYLQAIAENDKSNFYYKPCAKPSDGFTDETFGQRSIALTIQEMMRTAGYRSKYNNQSLRSLMDLNGNERMCFGKEYLCIAWRRTSATHRALKEISKKFDPPMSFEPWTLTPPSTPVLPSLDTTATVPSSAPLNNQQDRAVPQIRSAPPPHSLNPPPEKRPRIEEPSCTNLSQDLEVPPVKTEDPNQSGGVTVKTEVLDYNNNPEAASQDCLLVDTSPQCHLRTAVDVQHGSFNIRLSELLPPGAKDVSIKGTKSDTEEQILLKIDFRVG